mmetsp:Transcript_10152/g.15219  ORF Transcript_10152/g.15219 Transcript_10152/m.15219 type:complete len:87 (-) Transcript_10152:247-507(-)
MYKISKSSLLQSTKAYSAPALILPYPHDVSSFFPNQQHVIEKVIWQRIIQRCILQQIVNVNTFDRRKFIAISIPSTDNNNIVTEHC